MTVYVRGVAQCAGTCGRMLRSSHQTKVPPYALDADEPLRAFIKCPTTPRCQTTRSSGMTYDPGRCFWCENMQCDYCNGINEWRNPHASDTIGQPCKCPGSHPYKLRPRRQP